MFKSVYCAFSPGLVLGGLLSFFLSGFNEEMSVDISIASPSVLYHNPVISLSVPDPTVIHAVDGNYYLYGTENIRHIPIFKSTNMVDWEMVGTVFNDRTRPDFVKSSDGTRDASLWAPEIRYIKGKYVLFYSMAVWGDEWVSTIGYAVADTPVGPFVEKGKVFDSREIKVKNSIDQFYYEENGRHYMLWGSFRGIYIVELDITDDLKITPKPTTLQQIAGTAYEAVNVWKRGGYYYLFASWGSCCEEERSTYQTVVGRSTKLGGPYVDKSGRKMMDNHHEVVLHRNGAFVGTGHNSILIEDDNKDTWMFYHGFELGHIELHRQVFLDRVRWGKDGWPYVAGNTPSFSSRPPFVKKK